MCHYCGCRDMPLIRDYIAEHERATNMGGDAVRAIDRGELVEARALLDAMGTELRSHWQGEEEGLFTVMGRDELFAEHIARSCANTASSRNCFGRWTCPNRSIRSVSAVRSSNCANTSRRRRTVSSPLHSSR